MNIFFRLITSTALGALLWGFSHQVWSLGLGDAKVESYLGQPLEVTIDLITRPGEDLKSISANLASADDFALIGASREAISVPLRFSVEEVDGDAVVLVSSRLGVKDPVIRLVLEVDWESGRMLREYTLFLDPPTVTEPAPAPRLQSSESSQRETIPRSQPAQPARQPTEQRGEFGGAAGDEYGPVQGGETLWRIASDWSRGTGLDVNRVMIAIQRNNPRAFLNNNINLLQRGAVLRMPDFSEVQAMSSTVARNEVINQADAFSQRGLMTSAATPLVADEAATVPSATEAVENFEAEIAGDQLELVPPSEDLDEDSVYGFDDDPAESGATSEVAVLREELSRKEEELFNEQQHNQYLEDRIKELEGQVSAAGQPSPDVSADTAEGAVADAGLAAMEDRLREERLAGAEPEELATAVAEEAQAVQPASPAEDKPWYSGMTVWLIGLLVLLAAGAGWFMSRREEEDVFISDLGESETKETVREIADEAEEILQVLEPEAKEADESVEETQAPEPQTETVFGLGARKDEEAAVLDEESADPEIQLDLARAYIAMGDKEAARSILEEVQANGNEEQQADAGAMMDEL